MGVNIELISTSEIRNLGAGQDTELDKAVSALHEGLRRAATKRLSSTPGRADNGRDRVVGATGQVGQVARTPVGAEELSRDPVRLLPPRGR